MQPNQVAQGATPSACVGKHRTERETSNAQQCDEGRIVDEERPDAPCVVSRAEGKGEEDGEKAESQEIEERDTSGEQKEESEER